MVKHAVVPGDDENLQSAMNDVQQVVGMLTVQDEING